MRKKIYTFILLLFSAGITLAADVYIPDANFKNVLLADPSINTNSDGEISDAEAAAFTGRMNIGSSSISDLTGLEAFVNMTELDCYNNLFTTIDLSANTALTWLYCGANNLTSLDLSNNTALTFLLCNANYLTSIDVSMLPNLTTLDFSINPLTSIDLSNNTLLTILQGGTTDIASLDISNNTLLERFQWTGGPITSIDFTNNTALTYIGCIAMNISSFDLSQNINLRSLDLRYCPITSISLTNNVELRDIALNSSTLTTVDFSTCSLLEIIDISNSPLSSIDISQNTNLHTFNVVNCNLATLDATNCPQLWTLICSNNQITSLNVSTINLFNLKCDGNLLTSLNASGQPNLNQLYCFNNPSLPVIYVDFPSNAYANSEFQKDFFAIWDSIVVPAVNGPEIICPNTSGITYYITDSTATNYNWSTIGGITIVSGQGTDTITVDTDTLFTYGTISVSVTTTSGSYNSSLNVALNPTAPGPISGNNFGLCVVQENFSIASVSGATSYTWTAPTGATIISGQGTENITIDFDSTFVSDNLFVVANSGCGSSAPQSLYLFASPMPVSTITGITEGLCPGGISTTTYYASLVSGATSYTWTVPAGVNIVAGQGLDSVTVSFDSTFTGGTLEVTANNYCASSDSTGIALSSNPAVMNIYGPATEVCNNTYSYYANPSSGSSTYYWTAPTGSSIISGQGTSSIMVTYDSTFTSGSISVVPSNSCGNGAEVTLDIFSIPQQPSAITGPTTGLYVGVFDYSISDSTNSFFFNYSWTVPAGAYIIAGDGTAYISVYFDNTFAGGTISVSSYNACGNSASTSLILSAPTTPPAQGELLGPKYALCPAVVPTAVYYVSPEESGASYAWNVPTGVTITSGAGTDSILVSFDTTFTSGYVSVNVTSPYFGSYYDEEWISGGTATPENIYGNNYGLCLSQNVYTVSPVENAVSYFWNMPDGATVISGQGTDSILVEYDSAFTGGVMVVYPHSGCAYGTGLVLWIYPQPQTPASISGLSENFCPATISSTTYSVSESDGATSYTWTLPSGINLISGQGTDSIVVNFDSTFVNGTLYVTAANSCGSSDPAQLFINTLSPTAPVISGNSAICPVDNPTYTYNVPPADSSVVFNWSAPAGASIISGQGTSTVDVTFDSTFVSGDLSVTESNSCTTSAAGTFTITSSPPEAPYVNGLNPGFCPIDNPGVIYFANSPGATYYLWTTPPGTYISSGDSTQSPIIEFDSTFYSGELLVVAVNGCGNSSATSVIITATPPDSPTPVDAPCNLDSVGTATYSVYFTSGAISYTWTAPAGINILSGQGTENIVVSFDNPMVSDTLYVVANNSCGSSAPTLVLTNPIPKIDTIYGQQVQLCGMTTSYTAYPTVDSTLYTWTAPAGANIIGGQGTPTVTIQFDTVFTSGDLSVVSSTDCGYGIGTSLHLSTSPEQTPVINGVGTNLCAGPGLYYFNTDIDFNATSYNWNVPAGVTIDWVGGNYIEVIITGSFTSGSISVSTSNDCGSSPIGYLPLTLAPPLATLGAIQGPKTGLCPAGISTAVYYINTVAPSYTWTVPTGVTITSGQGNDSITVSFDSTFTSGDISVHTSNACGDSPEKTLAIKSVLGIPGTITGPKTELCVIGTSYAGYSINPVAGATSYTWTAPTGATILLGQGTDTITIVFDSTFTTGTLSVVADNACGSSNPRNVTLRSVPLTPGTISGPKTELCTLGTSTATYSVNPSTTGATSYTWTVPTGATITSGQGTDSVNVTFDSTFTSGNITVYASNACGNSGVRTLLLRSVPPTPGTISGIKVGLCPSGISSETYSISSTAGATSYTWTAPSGASIASGQGTTSVVVNFTGSFTTGAITVTADNACGSSNARSATLRSVTTTPGTITGTASVCPNATGLTYSISATTGATGYTWTAPSGATITSGQGSTSITVDWGTTAGNVTVVANNDCGSSAVRSKNISILSCFHGMSASVTETETEPNINIYPNPSTGVFNFTVNNIVETTTVVKITNILGEVVYSSELTADTEKEIDLTGQAQGVYMVQLNSGGTTFFKKIIIQ